MMQGGNYAQSQLLLRMWCGGGMCSVAVQEMVLNAGAPTMWALYVPKIEPFRKLCESVPLAHP